MKSLTNTELYSISSLAECRKRCLFQRNRYDMPTSDSTSVTHGNSWFRSVFYSSFLCCQNYRRSRPLLRITQYFFVFFLINGGILLHLLSFYMFVEAKGYKYRLFSIRCLSFVFSMPRNTKAFFMAGTYVTAGGDNSCC